MIYYKDENYLIRDLTKEDAYIITEEEIKQGWHQSVEKYLRRLEDKENGVCIAMVVEYKENLAGYINLYHHSIEGPKDLQGLPQIIDFGVLEKYRCNGIGTKLMDVAEELALKYSSKVYLSVGLHSGYGSAQRMYVKRGYIFDGSGVWYNNKICEPYSDCKNNDDLQLYMYKMLK